MPAAVAYPSQSLIVMAAVRLASALILVWSQVKILGKCEFANPSGSIKDRIADHILTTAEQEGKLKPGGTVVAATSGNTGASVAMIAAMKGYHYIGRHAVLLAMQECVLTIMPATAFRPCALLVLLRCLWPSLSSALNCCYIAFLVVVADARRVERQVSVLACPVHLCLHIVAATQRSIHSLLLWCCSDYK